MVTLDNALGLLAEARARHDMAATERLRQVFKVAVEGLM